MNDTQAKFQEAEANLAAAKADVHPSTLEVAVIETGDRVRFRSIKIHRVLGKDLEVVAGLSINDKVVVNPSGWLDQGETVSVKMMPYTAINH